MKKPASARRVAKPESDSPYRDFFELSPVAKAVLDSRGRLVLVNQAFLQRFCLDREAVLDGSVSFEGLFEQSAFARRLLEELRGEHVIRRREARMRAADGERLAMLVYGRIRPQDPRYTFEFSLVNITQHKAAEEALRRDRARLESLIESIGAGVFLVDLDGNLADLSSSAAALLAIPRAALIGRPHQELFGVIVQGIEEPEVAQHRLRLASQSVEDRPVIDVRRNEPVRILEIVFFPVREPDGSPAGWGGLIRDVTDDRDRLAWKLRLLSVLTRDIRAPLATLKGHATALLANYRQWDSPMVLEFLNVINRRTDELVRHVDRGLALTRLETGNVGMNLESIDPRELVQQAVERAAESLEDRPVTVDLPEDPPQVRVDPARIEDALVILLDNAARYAPPDSPVTIRASREGDMLKVSVADRGPGIPPDRRRLLFEKSPTAGTDIPGEAGIGLYIFRKFIEAHGGRIGVESPPEGEENGTLIFFTIPVVSAIAAGLRPEVSAPPAPDAGAEPGKRVLVIEREADYQALLRSILEAAGYRVETVPDGPSAIDIVRTAPPDLIVMEWTLPGMDGLSVCRNIRRSSSIPILVLTSKISQEDLVAALDAGADDYVVKPFHSPELLARVRSLLRRGDAWPEEELERFDIAGLTIDFSSRQVWISGKPVDLTPTEFDLLAVFARHPGQVLEYDQLADRLFGHGTVHDRQDLFIHISRVRKKIEPDPGKPSRIQTRWGRGYIFMPKPRK
jgi:PAS domain S-box-containing protein